MTVYDGTVLPPSTPFTKIWRMQNNGSTRWPYGTRLVWVGGDKFANRDSVLLEVFYRIVYDLSLGRAVLIILLYQK